MSSTTQLLFLPQEKKIYLPIWMGQSSYNIIAKRGIRVVMLKLFKPRDGRLLLYEYSGRGFSGIRRCLKEKQPLIFFVRSRARPGNNGLAIKISSFARSLWRPFWQSLSCLQGTLIPTLGRDRAYLSWKSAVIKFKKRS